MATSASGKSPRRTMIHSAIGIAIMLVICLLPVRPPHITEVGMKVLGIFAGTLYLWTTVSPLWSSLFSVAMLGIIGYDTMPNVLMQCFGNSVVVQMFFIMVFIAALTHYGITEYIGRFFLTRKFTNGRPWAFSFVILFGAFIMSVFVNCFAPIFLFWPVMYDVFKEVGFKKGAVYPKLMVILVVIAALLGFPVAPYMQNSLALLSNYRKMAGAGVSINDGAFFAFCFVTSLLILVAVVLFTKFVLRPDVTPLKKLRVEDLQKKPLPPMNRSQLVLFWAFGIYIISMLLPTLFPQVPVMKHLSSSSIGFALLFVALLCGILIDGRPVIEFSRVMEKDFAWVTFFLCATAILLGNVLTNKSTGITAFLNAVLSPLFQGMGTLTFTVVLLLTSLVLTNFCNHLVVGMILEPVILTYCAVSGANAAPLVTILIFFILLSAPITPAGSPFSAMMFGNTEWLQPKDIFKYVSSYMVVITALVLLVGIPLVNVLL